MLCQLSQLARLLQFFLGAGSNKHSGQTSRVVAVVGRDARVGALLLPNEEMLLLQRIDLNFRGQVHHRRGLSVSLTEKFCS